MGSHHHHPNVLGALIQIAALHNTRLKKNEPASATTGTGSLIDSVCCVSNHPAPTGIILTTIPSRFASSRRLRREVISTY
jgi:hypothetical protein